MAYNKTAWINDSTPAISAENLNKIENELEYLDNAGRSSESISSVNLMGIDVQENLYEGASDWSGSWTNSDPAKLGLSNETFMGYPVMYSSESWRRLYKTIPVVSGKTYTFECWAKASDVRAFNLQLTFASTTNPATISPTSKQFANYAVANKWTKFSVTFTCTASGNVTPHIINSYGAFYFAKYVLVEGDTAFSLTDSLNDKATKQEVSGIGDYIKYDISLGSSGAQEYWNTEIDKNVNVGEKVRLIFNNYSGTKLNFVKIDGKKSGGTWTNELCIMYAPISQGAYSDFIATENYIALRVQFARTQSEYNVTGSFYLVTDGELGIANDILKSNSNRIYHVEKDGSGDYTSFVDCVREACQYMDSVVYVGEGTFDLLDELGEDYVESASSSNMGLVAKNRVHIIGSSKTILKMNYTGELENVTEWLSPINTGLYGCTLENLRIESTNVRYSIHDDQGWYGDIPYTNKFINCELIHKNGMYDDCIGGGIGENCTVEIRGCYLEGDFSATRLAYYHGNNHTGIADAIGRIVVADNYFANLGTFKMTKYGDSEKVSTAYVSNNSFGSTPEVNSGSYAPYDNVQMIAWNNEIRS